MADPKTDDLNPGAKDPVEGAKDESEGAPDVDAPEQSHLGPAGNPAEG